jgi:CRP-like cAMP-binding protein
VADGQVRISRRIGGMGEEAIAILGRGEVFGEMAWIDSSPRSADAIAHTGGCTVLAVGRAHLDGTVEAEAAVHAQLLKTLCQVLCRRLRAMNDQLVAYRTIAWF